MTILHLSLALAIIAVAHFAGRWDGTEEAEKINAGKRIAHWWELTVRVVFLLLGLVGMYLIHDWLGTPQWKLFCVVGMAFGAFVPTHRYYVNTRRTTPISPFYVSPGNAYDRFWIRLCYPDAKEYMPIVLAAHQKVYNDTGLYHYFDADKTLFISPERYRGYIHSAGNCAYGFEAFVLILSTTTYVLA